MVATGHGLREDRSTSDVTALVAPRLSQHMRRFSAVIIALALTLSWPHPAAAAELHATYHVGSQPFGIATDPTDGRVYVANSGDRAFDGSGTISVIDPGANTVGTLLTTKPAGMLALDAVGRRLYSSNYDPTNDSASVDVIDLASGARVTSLPIGGLGVALDVSRSRLYVAGGRYLAAVDTTTFAMETRSAPFPQSWFGVAVDPGQGRVYVTNIDVSHPSLVVLDAQDLHTVANFSLSSVPRFALAVDPVRHIAYVAGSDPAGPPWTNSSLFALDGVAMTLRSTPTGFYPGGLALDAAAHRVWLTDETNWQVIAYDDSTLAQATYQYTMFEPALTALGPDGLLYVGAFRLAQVRAFDVAQNHPPIIDRLMFDLGQSEVFTNSRLTAMVDAHDPEGDAITISYQWQLNRVDIPGETGATLDLSKPGNGDRDDIVSVHVTVADATGSESTDLGRFVIDSAPAVTASFNTPAPKGNDVLKVMAVAGDADGDAMTYTFTWRKNGLGVFRTTTGASATDEIDLSTPFFGDYPGDVYSVTVVVSDDLRQSDPLTLDATVQNSAPSIALSLSDTTPKKKDVLAATVTAADIDGQPVTLSYTWLVNGVVKQVTANTSATTTSYDLRASGANVGDVVRLDVVATDGVSTTTTSVSATVTPAGH